MNILNIANERYSVKKFDAEFKLTEQQISQVEDLLIKSPSSVNIQPWHFTIATTKEGIEKVAQSTKAFGFNDEKIRDASALVVFSVADVDEKWLTAITEQEDQDGRYANTELKDSTDQGRKNFYNMQKQAGMLDNWLTNQVYLNAGHFLLGVSALGIDSVAMEGFDRAVLKEVLEIKQQPVLIVGLGRGHDDDYNKALNTSRLEQKKTITLI